MILSNRYIFRMFLFLAIIIPFIVIFFPIISEIFNTNIILNGLIVFALLIGILINFKTVICLRKEIRWANITPLDLSDLSIKPLKLLSPLAILLRNNKAKGNAIISPTIARTVLDSVSMRMDEIRDISRYLTGLTTFLGLLGTFWGLMGTVSSVGNVITSLSVAGETAIEAFETIKNGLSAPLSNMGIAFSSSLLGLASALILGFLDLQANGAQNHFYNELDEYLARLTRYSSSIGNADDQISSNGAYTNALLEQIVECLSDVRTQINKETSLEESTIQTDLDLIKYISRIDRNLAQLDRNAEKRQETAVKEMRDSFRILSRTISSGEEK